MENLATEDVDKRRVLAHYRDLQSSMSIVLRDIERGDYALAIQGFHGAQSIMTDFGDYLSTVIEPIYYNEHRAPDSVAAQKVFDIPELLEMTLNNLDIPDLMNCYGACRTMRDSIETSNKLQVKLCVRAAPRGTRFFTPFCSYYITCGKDRRGDVEAKFVNMLGSEKPLPNIGTRWKSMLICQPPVFNAVYFNRCKTCRLTDRWTEPHVVKSSRGLTLGDLFNAAEIIFELHRDCPGSSLFSSEETRYENGEWISEWKLCFEMGNWLQKVMK